MVGGRYLVHCFLFLSVFFYTSLLAVIYGSETAGFLAIQFMSAATIDFLHGIVV